MYDAIVVGARCAGSPAAMLLARKGYRVLLLDRATFPSDTMSTHFIHPPGIARLKRWGLLERVAASNCPSFYEMTFDIGPFALVGSPRRPTAASPSTTAPGARCSTRSWSTRPWRPAPSCARAFWCRSFSWTATA